MVHIFCFRRAQGAPPPQSNLFTGRPLNPSRAGTNSEHLVDAASHKQALKFRLQRINLQKMNINHGENAGLLHLPPAFHQSTEAMWGYLDMFILGLF